MHRETKSFLTSPCSPQGQGSIPGYQPIPRMSRDKDFVYASEKEIDQSTTAHTMRMQPPPKSSSLPHLNSACCPADDDMAFLVQTCMYVHVIREGRRKHRYIRKCSCPSGHQIIPIAFRSTPVRSLELISVSGSIRTCFFPIYML